MCSPTAMAMAMGGNSLLGAMSERSAIKQTNRANQEIAKRNVAAASEAMINSMRMLGQRESQEDYATGQQMREAAAEAYYAQGGSRASQAAAGVEGGSMQDLNQEVRMVETLRYASIAKQREFTQQDLENQKLAERAQTQGRINAAQPTPIPMPNMLGTLLNVGTSAATGYMSGVGYGEGGQRINAFTGKPLT